MAAIYITKLLAYGQSCIDFVLENYGCFEGIAQFIADNPSMVLSPTTILAPGTKVRVLNTVPQFNANNQAVLAQYKANGRHIASFPDSAPFPLLNENGQPLLGQNGQPLINNINTQNVLQNEDGSTLENQDGSSLLN